jgi:benzoyl-CoA reductase/2-hydroxyglutaryl-CoA dehydratase subunit BcrC/BadD/HgdB
MSYFDFVMSEIHGLRVKELSTTTYPASPLAAKYQVDGVVQCNLHFCTPYRIEAT